MLTITSTIDEGDAVVRVRLKPAEFDADDRHSWHYEVASVHALRMPGSLDGELELGDEIPPSAWSLNDEARWEAECRERYGPACENITQAGVG